MDKRYTVTISFHIWAKDDIAAMEQCKEMEAQAHKAHDNSAKVETIHQMDFASFESKEVYNHKKDTL